MQSSHVGSSGIPYSAETAETAETAVVTYVVPCRSPPGRRRLSSSFSWPSVAAVDDSRVDTPPPAGRVPLLGGFVCSEALPLKGGRWTGGLFPLGGADTSTYPAFCAAIGARLSDPGFPQVPASAGCSHPCSTCGWALPALAVSPVLTPTHSRE